MLKSTPTTLLSFLNVAQHKKGEICRRRKPITPRHKSRLVLSNVMHIIVYMGFNLVIVYILVTTWQGQRGSHVCLAWVSSVGAGRPSRFALSWLATCTRCCCMSSPVKWIPSILPPHLVCSWPCIYSWDWRVQKTLFNCHTYNSVSVWVYISISIYIYITTRFVSYLLQQL